MPGRSAPIPKGWRHIFQPPPKGCAESQGVGPRGGPVGLVPAPPAAAVLRVAGASGRGQEAEAKGAEQRRGRHGARGRAGARREQPGRWPRPRAAPTARACRPPTRPGAWKLPGGSGRAEQPIAPRCPNFPPIAAALSGVGGPARGPGGAGEGALRPDVFSVTSSRYPANSPANPRLQPRLACSPWSGHCPPSPWPGWGWCPLEPLGEGSSSGWLSPRLVPRLPSPISP